MLLGFTHFFWSTSQKLSKFSDLRLQAKISIPIRVSTNSWNWTPFHLYTQGRSPMFYHESWPSYICSLTVLKVLHCLPVRQRIQYKMAMLVHKCLNERAPEYLIIDCCWAGSRRSGTRSVGRQMLKVVRMNTSFDVRSFAAAAPSVWNSLPDVVRNSALSEDAFAILLKAYLMNCM